MEQYKNKDWLQKMYWGKELSREKIARLCGVAKGAILYWMKKYNIPRRSISEATSGGGNGNWKNGKRMHGNGYVYTLKPEHPRATKKGYILQHRLVMEEKLGRYLTPTEVVHHNNGIKDDNRVENLLVVPCEGKHNIRIQQIYKENLKLKKVVLFLLGLISIKGSK